MFEGFETATIDTGEAEIHLRHGGSGPPVLLLHGHPQTHAMWHRVAPDLARRHTVVCADLRGYGDSSKPVPVLDEDLYSKRAMARDMVAVMAALGHERFAVVGHDRGGRCAYRLALDHAPRIERLAVLDIVPTGEHFRRTEMKFALAYWHWFFLAQPYPLPDRMIGANPDAFYFRGDRSIHAPEALEAYFEAIRRPGTIRAMCDDYRAAAKFDCMHDEIDRAAGRKIACPVLALWSAKGTVADLYDPLAVWRDWADDVTGHAVDAGHYLAEEQPGLVVEALIDFLSA